MPTLQELLAQKAELERQIVETQRAAKDGALSQIRTLMDEFGLSVADLSAKARPPKAAKAAGGGKVAPKFRHPQTGETWTGRGLQPKWLKSALAAGAKLDSFRI